nr:MAG TPA_asm: hypothetical protein [Caudoviricetes sp.]
MGKVYLAPSERGLSPQGDWGREFEILILSLRHGLRRDTSLSEGGNGCRGRQPLRNGTRNP